MNLDQAVQKTSALLISAVKEEIGNLSSLSVSFSGGLDSSILVYIAKNYTSVKDFSLITTCFPGTYDVENSRSSAELLGLEVNFNLLDQNILSEGVEELSEIIGSLNPIEISYMLPFYFVCKASTETYILLGQGSDELFGGYHWQQDLSEEEFISRTNESVKNLLEAVKVREEKIADYFNKKLIMPFLNNNLIDFVLPLPKEWRAGKTEKYLLRLVAEKISLPKEIAWKHKKAAQYGSGVMKAMIRNKDSLKLEWK